LTFEDRNGNIPVEAVTSFLGQEKIPDGFTKRPDTFNIAKVLSTAATLRLRAL
jgi:hypothetical protein